MDGWMMFFTQSQTHTHTQAENRSHACSVSRSLSLTPTDKHTLSLPLTHTQPQTHGHGQTHTHSHTDTHSHFGAALVARAMDLRSLWNEDPVELLLDLGFGADGVDLSGRIPARFINHPSQARGMSIHVFLEAQKSRLDLENPDVSSKYMINKRISIPFS